MSPKFSIIIPIYNVEKYITQCLDSVVNQTFTDFEAICVDDCGSDNSIEIAEEFAKKDSRIKIIKHDKNRGLSAARNTALKASAGEYIICLDSDDWLENYCLAALNQKFKEKDVNCIIFDAYKYDDEHQMYFPEKVCGNKEGFLDITPDNICRITDYSWIKAYKKTSITKNNLYWPEGLTFEDGEFHMEYFSLNPRIFITEDCLYNYRVRKGSIVTDAQAGLAKIEDIYQIVRNVRNFYIERGLYEKFKKSVLQLVAMRIETCRCIVNNYEKSLPLSKSILEDFGFPNEFEEFATDI